MLTNKRKRPRRQADPEIPTSVRGLKTYFRHFDLDVRAPCTDADFSEAQAGVGMPSKHSCWLIRRVGVWNRFFVNIGVELRQDRLGKLSLRTFAPQCDPSLTDYGMVCATLLGDLLGTHRCIYYVHCGYSGRLFALKPRLFHHLITNAALEQFDIDGQTMKRDEANGLIKAMLRGRLLSVNISRLELRHCDVTKLSDYVESTTSLRELSLVDVGLRVPDIVALFKALESSKTVEFIKLEANTVGIRGAQQFAKVLEQNKTLRSATLQRARLQSNGAMAIASALAKNTTLIALRIASNGIGAAGTEALAEALKINRSLMVLDMRDNWMGNVGACAIAEMLTMNAKLEELHVCGNVITDPGIIAIAESLSSNQTLKVLSVFANGCGNDGVLALGRLLARNTTLQRLNGLLDIYGISSFRPLDFFTAALASNKTLREVQLFVWSSYAEKQLFRTFQLTETLQYLCISMTGPEIHDLCSALATNRSIQEIEINCFLNVESGAALAHLFEITTTIKAVTIVKKVTTVCLIHIFNSLAKNKSIWSLRLQCASLKLSACSAIATALKVNRTLCSVTLGRPAVDEVSLSALSAGIVENPIIQVIGLSYTTSSVAGFKIREHLHRNMHMMMQAIEFALALTACRLGAKAFEFYKESLIFQRELAKAGALRGRPSALSLIREANCFIEDNYFKITRVVKEGLVCIKPAHKGKHVTTFDELNEYCVKKVASYLKVSDVL